MKQYETLQDRWPNNVNCLSRLVEHVTYFVLFCFSGSKKKRKYSGSADADADWLPSVKGKHGSEDTPKRKSKRILKPKIDRY